METATKTGMKARMEAAPKTGMETRVEAMMAKAAMKARTVESVKPAAVEPAMKAARGYHDRRNEYADFDFCLRRRGQSDERQNSGDAHH